MGIEEFFPRAASLLGFMAILSAIEAFAPFRARARARVRLAANLGLTALFVVMQFLLSGALVGVATVAAERGLGLLHGLPQPWNALAALLALDGFAYAAHCLMHAAPALWRVHRVHHSDTFVDVTTAYRQHPLETLLRFAFTAVPALFLGFAPESVAIYRTVSGLNALLEHSNLRYPRWLETTAGSVLVTPERHKIHHSRQPAQTDSCFANVFSLWDRAFGTLRPSGEGAQVTYGLDEYPQDVPLPRLLRLG